MKQDGQNDTFSNNIFCSFYHILCSKERYTNDIIFFRRNNFEYWSFYKMKRAEWQKFHNISDEKISDIDMVIKELNAKITRIFDVRKYGKFGDETKVVLDNCV